MLADGFSCRTQIDQADTGRRAVHLAEALALALDGPVPVDHPERLARRPETPLTGARLMTAGIVAAACAAATMFIRIAKRGSRTLSACPPPVTQCSDRRAEAEDVSRGASASR